MANRVCFGRRNASEIGLFISKPGFNVLTASTENLMFATNQGAFQVIQRGYVSLPIDATGTTITIPNVGYNPVVLMTPQVGNDFDIAIGGEYACTFEHLSLTSIRLRIRGVGVQDYTGSTSYLVINKPAEN